MEYEPKEGIDYLVDLYALAEIERTSDAEDVRHALNERAMEYHPDRLEGLAPEFRDKGELVAKLLNRARVILLDADRRAEYDEILSSWEGPISTSGIPIVTYSRMLETGLSDKSPEEIEAKFASDVQKIEGLTGYSPRRLSLIERLIENAGDNVPDDMREEYEDALLQKDHVLAVEEGLRSELLGLPDLADRQHRASLDYSAQTRQRIEEAKTSKLEYQKRLALGGVSTRLALLSGEASDDTSVVLSAPTTIGLPHYFEQQSARVTEIAEERESIIDKRLKNFEPTFPEAELQTEQRENLIIGMETDDGHIWFVMKFDIDTDNAAATELADEIKDLLNEGDYKTVIQKSYGVVLVKPMEHVDVMDLFGVAIGKYTNKFK
jgi:curved DNA-binding protein CbpA